MHNDLYIDLNLRMQTMLVKPHVLKILDSHVSSDGNDSLEDSHTSSPTRESIIVQEPEVEVALEDNKKMI